MTGMRIDHEVGQTVALLQRATKGKPSAEADQSNKASAVSFSDARRNVRGDGLRDALTNHSDGSSDRQSGFGIEQDKDVLFNVAKVAACLSNGSSLLLCLMTLKKKS